MDDSAVFINFARNALEIATQKNIDVIINFVEYFEGLLAVNDGEIDTFVKDTHSANNYRAAAQIILIRNNVT